MESGQIQAKAGEGGTTEGVLEEPMPCPAPPGEALRTGHKGVPGPRASAWRRLWEEEEEEGEKNFSPGPAAASHFPQTSRTSSLPSPHLQVLMTILPNGNYNHRFIEETIKTHRGKVNQGHVGQSPGPHPAPVCQGTPASRPRTGPPRRQFPYPLGSLSPGLGSC